MREASPGPNPEAARADKQEARMQLVLDNVRALNDFADDKLQDKRWGSHTAKSGEHFSGAEVRAFFDTRTGRLIKIDPKADEVPEQGYAAANMFVGMLTTKPGLLEPGSYVRVAEWSLPSKLYERYPEAMAALSTSFKAFELANKQRSERRGRSG